ncbi:MAG: GxxExxY protein [Acidobacteria bacterium]|nr:MAG: GxxExxY protein [Acidobacteriota bacterium]REJ98329.1 MAG: GxxExxY protein [Acidobacteriota bacterium]REK17073.1 MAG: GxxExxY protein [Acidobacteriota bacterium]REK42983.1 MAG: GxxExxY protein [Acidobacteriota bacterium]
MENEQLSATILQAAFEVSNELGAGFVESVYQKSLLIALMNKGLEAKAEVAIDVEFRGENVGRFYADILVEDKIILELKAVDSFVKQHFAQILNYLKATDLPTGLILNFGKPRLEYRRFDNRFCSTAVLNPRSEV